MNYEHGNEKFYFQSKRIKSFKNGYLQQSTPPRKRSTIKFHCPDGPQTPPVVKNRREIFEARRLPKILSFDSLIDEFYQPNKRSKVDENFNEIENDNTMKFERRTRKVAQKEVCHKKISSRSLSPISEIVSDGEGDVESENFAKINELVSRDKLRLERKLFRESLRNQKRLRKTTLIEGIKEMINEGFDIDEEIMKKFKKIRFANDIKTTMNLKSCDSTKLKKTKLKISAKLLKSESAQVFNHGNFESSPPKPPRGNPPLNCPQPKYKDEIKIFENLPSSLIFPMIQTCISSLENL
jgi:hypothetical protein